MDEQTIIQPEPEVTPEIKRPSLDSPNADQSRRGGEEYLTMAQAARVSGYQQDYLGQLARQGKLKAVKSGHNWITTRSAVETLALTYRKVKPVDAVNLQRETVPEVKSEIKIIPPEPVKEILPLPPPDPSFVHSLHAPVSEDNLPHAPSIQVNI